MRVIRVDVDRDGGRLWQVTDRNVSAKACVEEERSWF
ncbi:hypothetical protein GPL20_25370 [Bradyrhizobium cajani]|uniref:Uncharacterized protein n=1 Tax=Bradyrhizobium cajani TaxID=1928661 RepID=A0A844TM00_9BRAD|nr:hypothetical protein [Bradyrhizobium cajani]